MDRLEPGGNAGPSQSPGLLAVVYRLPSDVMWSPVLYLPSPALLFQIYWKDGSLLLFSATRASFAEKVKLGDTG